MYKVNDYLVYRHDVCKIKEIKKDNLTGDDCYVLVPLTDETLTMRIPINNKTGYVRDLLTKDAALKLIKGIQNILPIANINDKNIENVYKDLLNNSSHENLIKIIKTTYLRNKERLDSNKKISEIDKYYFEKAKQYLYNELSVVLDLSFDEVENLISKNFLTNF